MTATIGDNSLRVDRNQLKGFIERVERLEEEKRTVADDIKDVYAEAKAHGYDVQIMRQMVRRRRQDREERETRDALLALYEDALKADFIKE